MSIEFVSGNIEYLSSDSSFDPPASGTCSLWIYWTGALGRPMGFHDAFELRTGAGLIYNEFYKGGSGAPSTAVSGTTLYHLVFTWAFSAPNVTQEIYKNGALVTGPTVSTGTDPGSGTLEVGRSRGLNPISAIISDLRFYDRVLPLAEVQTIYAGRGVDPILDGLIHRFLFDEAAPGVALSGAGAILNEVDGGFTMTPTNTPTAAESPLAQIRRAG